MNYYNLPGFVLVVVPSHFGLPVSGPELAQMRQASTRNAKAPEARHADDRTEKRLAVTAEIQAGRAPPHLKLELTHAEVLPAEHEHHPQRCWEQQHRARLRHNRNAAWDQCIDSYVIPKCVGERGSRVGPKRYREIS